MNASTVANRAIKYVLLGLLALTILYPLFWMGTISLRDNSSALANPFGFDGTWSLDNYIFLIEDGRLGTWITNSVIVNVLSVVFIALLAAVAAYGFSTFDFPGKNIWFGLLIIGLMVPPQALVIAGYRWIEVLGIENSYLALVMTYLGWTPFGILVMRNFFDSVPKELREAATMDGAGHVRIFLQVMLPLARPALTTVIIFNVIWVWNDFIYPLVYIQSPDLYTVPVGVLQFAGRSTSQIAVQMAVLAVATALPLLVYLLFRKQFVRGVLEGAVKG
ncbi:carbohydrate ABC transporter permease [Microbacterium sp. NPDC058389]|uniref:carbohydrate ABC transporter permease n=1 Tax=Microbacterium sp. NPDC058389 TaxID=3346475 RepID=UPI003669F541